MRRLRGAYNYKSATSDSLHGYVSAQTACGAAEVPLVLM